MGMYLIASILIGLVLAVVVTVSFLCKAARKGKVEKRMLNLGYPNCLMRSGAWVDTSLLTFPQSFEWLHSRGDPRQREYILGAGGFMEDGLRRWSFV